MADVVDAIWEVLDLEGRLLVARAKLAAQEAEQK